MYILRIKRYVDCCYWLCRKHTYHLVVFIKKEKGQGMKRILILVATLFALISIVVILGNIITVGEKMTTVFGVPYFEYAFYVLLIGLFVYLCYVAIIQPMRIIHKAPEFPKLDVEEKEEGMSDEVYRGRLISFAGKLANNCSYLPVKERASYQSNLMTEYSTLKDKDIESVKQFIKQELKPRYKAVDKQILKYGTKVFIITAVSSSNRLDTLATIGLNYRMVADIVRASGFRPNKLQLIKVYWYVISAAFLSYFFQDAAETAVDAIENLSDVPDVDVPDIDVEIPDVDPSNVDFTQYVKNMNLPGIPLAPLADGLANAIMTIAIGYIVKYYLQKGSAELKGAKGRKVKLKAKMKALGQVPLLLAEVPTQLGKTGLSWVVKGFEKYYKKVSRDKKPDDEDVFDDMEQVDEEDVVSDAPKKKGLFNFWK